MEYEKIILDLLIRVNELEEQVARLNELTDPKKAKQPGMKAIKEHICQLKSKAEETGAHYITVKANDIHKQMKLTSRMPAVCNAMKQCMQPGDEILHETASGYSSTFEVKYYLDT